MSCACALVARSMALCGRSKLGLVHFPLAQELRGEEQTRQRRAELVGKRRQKEVLRPVRVLRARLRRRRFLKQVRSLHLGALTLGDVFDGQQDQQSSVWHAALSALTATRNVSRDAAARIPIRASGNFRAAHADARAQTGAQACPARRPGRHGCSVPRPLRAARRNSLQRPRWPTRSPTFR